MPYMYNIWAGVQQNHTVWSAFPVHLKEALGSWVPAKTDQTALFHRLIWDFYGAHMNLLVKSCFSSFLFSQLSAALTLSKPVIPLALEPISVSPTSLLKDLLAIRFYTKPGEVKVTMGFWVEHKFQELLMRLNYLRILPHERIITKGILP